MAAVDLTGPPALNFQSNAGLAGKVPSARPSNEGPPRNIGQSAATALSPTTNIPITPTSNLNRNRNLSLNPGRIPRLNPNPRRPSAPGLSSRNPLSDSEEPPGATVPRSA